ncbi:MAG: ribonuclease HII [Clostridia bacterium]|nr:ribonuclease HII [Clostridia bacterium]
MAKIKIKDIENELKDMEVGAALNYLKRLQESEGMILKKLIEKYAKKVSSYQEEQKRFNNMCLFEKEAFSNGVQWIAGIDEAGRGPLAGPVVAAAVIFPKDVFIHGLNDSKKVSPKKRDSLYDEIIEKAIAVGVGIVDSTTIDEINILNAAKKAMSIAVEHLEVKPELLLIDAERLPEVPIEQTSIIGGDRLSISIAAASIIAKVTRDKMITEMDDQYPEYGFAKHKGYGTKEHIDAIKKFGICPIHRISFTKNFV